MTAMDWAKFDLDRFAKMMALAFSAHDNEALVALRKAGQLLDRAGGNFDSLVQQIKMPDGEPPKLTHQPNDPMAAMLRERLARAETRTAEVEKDAQEYKKQFDEAVKYIIEIEALLNEFRMTGRRSG